MKRKLLYSAFITFLVVFQAQAQRVEINPFQKIYSRPGSQKFLDIIEVDTTIVLLGSTLDGISSSMEIMSANPKSGNIYSSNVIGAVGEAWNPFQLHKGSEGSYWVVSEHEFVDHSYTHIIKLDDKFSVLEDYSIGSDTTYQRMNFLSETDGYFYLAGTYSSPSMSFGNDYWIVKMRKNGDVVWDVHFGYDSINEVASSLQVSGDKIFVYGDKNHPDFTYNPYVITMDTAGNFFSDTPLDWSHNCGVKTSCITDDAIYVTGESATSTSTWFDIYLEKFDLQGNRVWRKMLPGSNKSETGFDIKLYDGKLFFTGYAYNFDLNNTDMHCTITDTAGTILEERLYNLGNIDVGYQVLPTNKGGYYVAGTGFNGSDTEYMLVFDTTNLLQNISSIDASINDQVKIYPNPGRRPIISLSDNHTFGTLEIIDLQGKMILYEDVSGKRELRFPKTEKGVYFVRIINQHKTEVKKVITR